MRKPKWLLLVAMLAALSLVAAACGGDDDEGDDAGGGGGDEQVDCTWTIGTMGALSGDAASLGQPIAQGVEYAVNAAEEAGELPCKLEYIEEDSQGDPTDIPAVREFVVSIFDEANYEGVAKTYSWEDTGEFVGGPDDIWIYEWSNEAENFVSVGPAAELLQ